MKTTKAIVLMLMAGMLCTGTAMAQRGGGGRSGGGSSHSSSVSSSRSSSPSSSRSSSFSSSSSRSSSSISSSSSSSSSRSAVNRGSSRTSSPTSRGSLNAPSRSSAAGTSRGVESPRTPRSVERSSSAGVGTRSGEARGSHFGVRGREAEGSTSNPRRGVVSDGKTEPHMAPSGATHASGRPSSDPSVRNHPGGSGYARPGMPGGHVPPADRPVHPAPYFHHPWHGHMVHCHPLFWDPIPPRPWYWPGFWAYCHSYWYDYHVTDVVVVRQHVQDAYHVDMITYGISGDIMYAIVRDGGSTYLQVYDKDDHLLAEQKISKKYCNMVIDAENGGCWISKKKNKDPLLFLWADGQLLIYEAD